MEKLFLWELLGSKIPGRLTIHALKHAVVNFATCSYCIVLNIPIYSHAWSNIRIVKKGVDIVAPKRKFSCI